MKYKKSTILVLVTLFPLFSQAENIVLNHPNSDNIYSSDSVQARTGEVIGLSSDREAGSNISELPVAILTPPDVNCTEVFDSTSKLEEAVSREMEPGTTLCLADGIYDTDLEITFGGQGTESQPIKVAAENSGKAIITGDMNIIMGGQYTQLQGLVFDGGNSLSSNVISTRFGTGDLCHHCRITEIAILNVNANEGITSGDTSSGEWVHIYGQNNWLDHSILSGKTTASPMISFNRWVDESWDDDTVQAELAKNIIVYKNYIANRVPAMGKMYAESSDNNYEAIRTGLSETHHFDGNSIILGNLFENIEAEAEIISNKASHNTISGNTIRNSYGSITNRHGNSNAIESNFIFGDGHPFAGGLRIVDDSHSIVNNYIEGARYKETTHHGGIVLLGSDGAGDAQNGYQQLENVHVAHNTIVDSVNSLNIDGGGKPEQPNMVYLANNLIDHGIGSVITQAEHGLPPFSEIVGNIVYGQHFSDDEAVSEGVGGFEYRSAELVKSEDGLYRPAGLVNLTAQEYYKGDFTDVLVDMDGQTRSETTTVGADEILGSEIVNKPLSYEDVGPVNYQLTKPTPIMQVAELVNPNFDNELNEWSYNDAVIIFGDEAFSRNASAVLEGGDAYLSQEVNLIPNTRYGLSAFVKGPVQFNLTGIGSQSFNESTIDYQWVSWEFDSGTTEYTTLSLTLAEEIPLYANIEDNQLTDFRNNGGNSDFWISHEDNDNGLGDVGSSSDTANGPEGSARIRFNNDDIIHDFTATPGLSQVIYGLKLNTDYVYSLYYDDRKGDDSPSSLYYGVRAYSEGAEYLSGEVLAEEISHVKDLDDTPEGPSRSSFKQVEVAFNSGEYTTVEIFALMQIDATQLSSNSNISEQTEVRIDEFTISHKSAPEEGMKGYFDDVHLISRTDKE